MKGTSKPFFAGENDEGKRLDRLIRQFIPSLPLSRVYSAIRRGGIRVNGQKTAVSYRIKSGDRVDVEPALAAQREAVAPLEKSAPLIPKGIVLYRDQHVLALNKPYGISVHGKNSLADQVVKSFAAALPSSLSFRPGPVHRLDRNTTGVQLFSLSLRGAQALSRLFLTRRVSKVYCALVAGRLERPAVWEDRLARDRKEKKTVTEATAGSAKAFTALTTVLPVFPGRDASLVFFLPKTGRTHQLRAQAARHGHPLPGDKKYGGSPDAPRYFLHSLGLAVREADFPLAPIIAPFDAFQTKIIGSRYGADAVTLIRNRAWELLSPPRPE